MKVTKPFCVDSDLLDELSKINASDLVNSLLRDHFDGKNSMNLGKLKQKLSKNLQKKKVLLKETRELRRKIAKIEEKEAKILKISKQYPPYVFKIIDGCKNLPALFATFRHDKTLKEFGWMELKKLFNNLKGGASQ